MIGDRSGRVPGRAPTRRGYMGMHIAFVSMPAHGHVNPTLPLVSELVRRGHRVSYATGPDMLETVRGAGAEPVAAPFTLPGTPPPLTGDTPLDPRELLRRMEAFATSVEDTFPVLVEHFGDDRPDTLCGDAMSPVTGLVAQKLGVPYAASNPTFASNEHFSLRRDVLGRSAAAAPAEQAFAHLGARIAEFAASQGLDHDAAAFGAPAALNLVFIPREFQPAGDTFDESYVFLGPSVRGRRGDARWAPPDRDAPLLLISLGTVFNARPDFFRRCLDAFGGTRWQVLMAVGERIDQAELGAVPANVQVRAFVPQVHVLERADAFLTHNGMNSTMEALYFGVPQIGVPQMPEQEMNARRVQEIGCGRRLDPRALDAPALAEAVDAVATDPRVRENCARFARRLQASDGAVTGADALERFGAQSSRSSIASS